jgi:predicted outer membrane repeat protein
MSMKMSKIVSAPNKLLVVRTLSQMIRSIVIACLVIILVFLPASSPVSAASVWYVDDDNCPGPGTGMVADPFCTLATAISAAAPDDIIYMHSGIYGGGHLIISALTILGLDSADTVIIDGGGTDRGFLISGSTVLLSHLTIQNGGGVSHGGGVYATTFSDVTLNDVTIKDSSAMDSGGGLAIGSNSLVTTLQADFLNNSVTGASAYGAGISIANTASFNMNGGSINSNTASGVDSKGGGIYNYGTLTINGPVMINDNEAQVGGGGLYHAAGSSIIPDTSFVLNRAAGSGGKGGGVYIDGTGLPLMDQVLIYANNAYDQGGGIYTNQDLAITNSTITTNYAWNGGGIYIDGAASDLDLFNVTVTKNTSPTAPGKAAGIYSLGNVTLANSIVAENNVVNCETGVSGSFVTNFYNMEDNDTCNLFLPPLDFPDTDPMLGPAADNGGNIYTHALMLGSPAINAGNPAGCTDHLSAPLTTDQRGFTRPVGGRCDIGAYESQHPFGIFLPLIMR